MYKSGARKRKERKEKERVLNKTPKLTKFYKTASSPLVDREVYPELQESGDQLDILVSAGSEALESSIDLLNNISEQIGEDGQVIVAVESDIPGSSSGSEKNKAVNENVFQVPSVSETSICGKSYNNIYDPALWLNITDSFINEVSLVRDVIQNVEQQDFEMSTRTFSDGKKRTLQKSLFYREMRNGEVVRRQWLLYSPSCGSVFCFVCKLFCKKETRFVTGYNDWKHCTADVVSHERSDDHKMSERCWLSRNMASGRIDTEMARQLEYETGYWKKVLLRIIAVIGFLSERGLAFRGDSEVIGSPNNGNYLGAIELIAKFDPFLTEHLIKYGNKGSGSISYLSSTVCNEFIELIGNEVQQFISREIEISKYFSFSADSTPDVSHEDQLVVTIRYVKQTGQVVERFLIFVVIHCHTGVSLAKTVLDVFVDLGINFKYCRGQTFDNASNMSGKYNGMQAVIKKANSLCLYVPCAAHSLNLIGKRAVESCLEAMNYFGIVQGVYNFFVASTHRWNLLLCNLSPDDRKKVTSLKSLSDTRWSAHASATKAFQCNYTRISNVLKQISTDLNYNVETRHEANSLVRKMEKLETALLTILWNRIMLRFHEVSVYLQGTEMDINRAADLLHSLRDFVSALRSDDMFSQIEREAKLLTEATQYDSELKREKIQKRHFDETSTEKGSGSINITTAKTKFKIETYNIILDRLFQEIDKRASRYVEFKDIFGFLHTFANISDEEIANKCTRLLELYNEDIEPFIVDECIQLKHLPDIIGKSSSDLLLYLKENKLDSRFPNFTIALRIYLTIPISNCEGERAFSRLKRIKNEFRSNMIEGRLNALSIMAIESDVLRAVLSNSDDIISKFSKLKARKTSL